MRILHTMLRVGNLEKSIAFYTEVLGMKLLRQSENPEYKYTLAFVGYGDESSNAVLELTYNWGVDSYDLGSAFGHIALEVENVYDACDKIRAKGGVISREPGPVKGGTTEIAFVRDPDNYAIELIQKKVMAYKENKTDEIAKIEEEQNGILKRKYLYSTNFAVNNGDYEVSPYVALAEIYDINLKYLDTIHKTMTPKVAKSLYGKKLTEYYNERKKSEK